MKKVLLVLIVLAGLSNIAMAQKGSLLVYGNLNIASSTDSFAMKSNSYSINPGIGYQVSNNWTIGVNFGFGQSKSEVSATTSGNPVPSGTYSSNKYFNLGAFLRYSYPISNIFSIYGQADFGYLSGKKLQYGLQDGSFNGFGADLFPAVSLNIKNGFALNFSFGGISYQAKTYKGTPYNPSQPGVNPPNSSNQFAFTFGQGATFGISKNFGMKKKQKK